MCVEFRKRSVYNESSFQIDNRRRQGSMHKAERAIIMGAGMGTRLRPATDNLPKPLVRVNGVRIIDTVIGALRANGIREIHIVTGYRAEAWQELLKDDPDLDLIYNPYYAERNNISSMYEAREYLHSCVCVDGDNLIYRPEILMPEFEFSGYAGIPARGQTDEWLMVADENRMVRYTTKGGREGWQLFGVCHLSEEDGLRLRGFLEEEYVRNRRYDIYWDDVAMFLHRDAFRFQVHPIQWGDIQEIDSFEELCELDPGYLRK